MLEYPPREGFFRRKFWNPERNARLAVRREAYFVRTFIIDANAHHIKSSLPRATRAREA
jgi:hypothetical protein